MPNHYAVEETQRGMFFFRLVSGRGHTLMTSFLYGSRVLALIDIQRARSLCWLSERFVRGHSPLGVPYWFLADAKGVPLSKRQECTTATEVEARIATIMEAGTTDLVYDVGDTHGPIQLSGRLLQAIRASEERQH